MADKMYGVYRGTIVSAGDPAGAGRVQVRIPSVLGGASAWAPVCRPFGAAAGAPRICGNVLVAFEAGDPEFPVVLGLLG